MAFRSMSHPSQSQPSSSPRPVVSGSGPSLPRDVRIDVVRGLALVMIFINHIPGNYLSWFTFRAIGFADAAEMFVVLAGVSAALAFAPLFVAGGILRALARLAARVWKLYIAHLALFVFVAGLSAWAAVEFDESLYLESLGLDAFAAEPMVAIARVVTLTFQPTYLDILPLYIVLLAVLPVLLLLFSVHSALALALSLALYGAMQVAPYNLPNYQAARVWFFNPFAWQFLFACGVYVGLRMRRAADGDPLPKGRFRHLGTGLALLFVAAAFVVAAPWRAVPALANTVLVSSDLVPAVSKTDLSPLRLFDALARLWLVFALVPAGAAMLRSFGAVILGRMGRHSLDVFCLGVVLAVAGTILAHRSGFDAQVMALVNIAGLGAMAVFALVLDWSGRDNRQDRPIAPRAKQGVAGQDRDEACGRGGLKDGLKSALAGGFLRLEPQPPLAPGSAPSVPNEAEPLASPRQT